MGPFKIVEFNLRRGKGVKKKGPGKGTDCACYSCIGICGAHVIEATEETSIGGNVIIEDLGGGTAKLYILEQPDIDVTVDPTLYIDDDVYYSFNGNTTTILAYP